MKRNRPYSTLIDPRPGCRGCARAEHLVGVGFRCWLTALRSGDRAACQPAIDAYRAALGVTAADPILMDLIGFVSAVHCSAARRIEVEALDAKGLGRDESLAVAVVAASQHAACPALRACAAVLIGSGDVGRTLAAADPFALHLREAGAVLSVHSVVNAAVLEAPPAGYLN